MARRTTRSRSRLKNTLPARGSKEGDILVGTCDGQGCGRNVHMGDVFIPTLSGHLFCRPCWEKPDPLGLETFTGPATVEHISEAIKVLDANEIAEDYGPDNPFF